MVKVTVAKAVEYSKAVSDQLARSVLFQYDSVPNKKAIF